MSQPRYLIQSLDPGAYTIIDRATRICYILMVNSIINGSNNIQLSIIEVSSPQTENQRFANAERETFSFLFFAANWFQVEEMIKDVLFGIIHNAVDLNDPVLLGCVYGGYVNGEVAPMLELNPDEVVH